MQKHILILLSALTLLSPLESFSQRNWGYGNRRFASNRLEVIARELSDSADRALNSYQERRDTRGVNLSRSLSNFANSARIYSDSVVNSNSRDGGLRGARNLIMQAERIDRSMARLPGNSQLRSEWMAVQNEVARLSSALNLSYSSNARLAARDADPYYDSSPYYNSSPYSNTGSGYFRWQGQVDGSDHIILQGSRVSIRHLQAQRIVNPSYDLRTSLPRYPVVVNLRQLRGRGDVQIVDQPTARNNYAVTILVEDRSGGSDFYEFELTW